MYKRQPADDVHLTTDESNITVIQSGPSEFSLVGVPAEAVSYTHLDVYKRQALYRVIRLVNSRCICQT